MARPGLLVAKVGSSTLVDEAGSVDGAYVESLCAQIGQLVEAGTKVVLVSSGAAAAGREVLGLAERPRDIETLQACAAAGQARLTQAYADVLRDRGIVCGQVLLTRRDVTDREGYLNARRTLTRLLELGVVPVVNENDTVSVAEFAFGDNDMLGAIVAAMLGADLYVILSDVSGLYTANPQTSPDARLVEEVSVVDEAVTEMAGGAVSSFGTGGMASKLRAARAMLAAGVPMVICQGRRPNVLVELSCGARVGTRFEAPEGAAREGGRKLWIGLAEVPHGTLVLDEGAARAVVSRGASILPVGVTAARGSFEAGDVVTVEGPDGGVIGRGVVRYSSEDIARVRGLKLEVIARFLGPEGAQPAVHRDDLLVL